MAGVRPLGFRIPGSVLGALLGGAHLLFWIGYAPVLGRVLEHEMGEPLQYAVVVAAGLIANVGGGWLIGRLYDRVRYLSITDSLTGLYNRRQFFLEMERHLRLARRHGHPLAVVMLDIDRFKQLNDAIGHLAGDAALTQVARAVLGTIRASDLAGRYGGEEFILLLPQTDAKGAYALTERLREQIASLPLERPGRLTTSTHGTAGAAKGPVNWADTVGNRITVSCGIAVFPDHGSEVEDLVRRADAALYEAKKVGNQTRCALGPEAGPGVDPVAPAPPLVGTGPG